jgi:hypothetical protein
MQAWVMIAMIAGFNEPVVIPFESEERCRTAQVAITLENNRLGRGIETGCYVLTPTPESVTHPKARLVK